jgi:hypothetical protein
MDVSMVNLTHENGLTLSIASDFINKKIQDGFVIYPEGGLERRSPIQVVVTFNSGQQPDGDWPKSKSVNGVTVHYRQSSQSGGSGGTEYFLETWKSCVGGYIKTEQMVQLERGDPDFSMTWAVIANANRKE